MVLNLDAVLKNIHGEPIKDGEKDACLGLALINALLADDQNKLPPAEKLERWQLAKKVKKGGSQDFKIEEVALMKKSVEKTFNIAVMGEVIDHLEAQS